MTPSSTKILFPSGETTTTTTMSSSPDPKTLLTLSEHFLRRRYFTDCHKYAHQAHQLNPHLPGATQILAVADVFLAGTHQTPTGSSLCDWYQVLNLPRYTHDSNLITNQYGHLSSLLNPLTNKFPFADEAFEIVSDAWRVLSDGVKKSEFDLEFKKVVGDIDGVEGEGGVGYGFWTVCPYCYYLYEYDRIYIELCVRCPNEECGKAFTCVEIEKPPVGVLEVGKYVCDGFVLIGLKSGCWNPFAVVKNQKPNSGDGNEEFVTISDDDDEVKGDECGKVAVSAVKPNVGRKKSAARKTKKVTGVGNRVRKEAFVHQEDESDDCEFF